MTNQRSKSGVVLLLVLGLLALMSVMAITFVKMTSMEKAISTNYVYKTRALMVAESGLEYAISRIHSFQGASEDIAAMQYELAADDNDLENAVTASFQKPGVVDRAISGIVSSSYAIDGDYFVLQVDDTSGKINLNDTDGKWNIDKDPHPEDLQNIDDEGIVINGVDSHEDMRLAERRLTKLVETLGTILFDTDSPGTGFAIAIALLEPTAPHSRWALPGGKFKDMQQVHDALMADVPGFTEEDYQAFAKHVTLWSWQDPDTIRPTFQLNITVPDVARGGFPDADWANMVAIWGFWPLYDEVAIDPVANPYGIPKNFLGDSWDDSWNIYMFMDMQTRSFEQEARCPVNVNAASIEVLTALLTPIKAWYMYEGPAEYWASESDTSWASVRAADRVKYFYAEAPWWEARENMFGAVRESESIGKPLELATAIYERVHGDGVTPGERFGSWTEFEEFLHNPNFRDLIKPTRGYVDLMQPWEMGKGDLVFEKYWTDYFNDIFIDILLANFNPNSRLNDYNPDHHIYQHVDKAQLTQYTTELCFDSSYFEIRSTGIIKDASDQTLAKSELSAVVELWATYRETTQAQFMSGLENGGANLGDYFSENRELGFLPTAGYQIFPPAPGVAGGYTLQSYPEPIINDDTYADGVIPPFETDKNYVDDSIYDGFLTLACYRMHESVVQHEANPRMICNFDSSLKPHWLHEGVSGMSSLLYNGAYVGMATDDMMIDFQGDDINQDIDFKFEWYDDPLYNINEAWASNNGWITAGSKGYTLATNQPSASRLCNAAETPHLPGVLFPDGALSDAGRTLSYKMANIGRERGAIGSIGFWMKPNYDPAISNRIRTIWETRLIRNMTVRQTNQGTYFITYVDARAFDGSLTYYPHSKPNTFLGKNEVSGRWADGYFGDNPFLWETNAMPPCSMMFYWNSISLGPIVHQYSRTLFPAWPDTGVVFDNANNNNSVIMRRSFQKFARTTTTMNHTWPGHHNDLDENNVVSDEGTRHDERYHYENREWSYILLSWDKMKYAWHRGGNNGNSRFVSTVTINNDSMVNENNRYVDANFNVEPYIQDKWRALPDYVIEDQVVEDDFIVSNFTYANYFRFGEFASKMEHVLQTNLIILLRVLSQI